MRIGSFVCLIIILCLLCLSAISAGRYLVTGDRLERADVIVVLSGNDTVRIDDAASLYQQGISESIMLTNTGQRFGDYDLPYTMLQKEQLRELGVPEGAVFLADFEAKNTGQEATGIINKMYEMSARSAIIVTNSWHTRRVKTIFSDSFGNTGFSVQIFPVDDGYDRNFWWLSLGGWRITCGEYFRLLGYYIKRETHIPDYPSLDFLKR